MMSMIFIIVTSIIISIIVVIITTTCDKDSDCNTNLENTPTPSRSITNYTPMPSPSKTITRTPTPTPRGSLQSRNPDPLPPRSVPAYTHTNCRYATDLHGWTSSEWVSHIQDNVWAGRQWHSQLPGTWWSGKSMEQVLCSVEAGILSGCQNRVWNNTENGSCESNNRDKVRCRGTTDQNGNMCQVDGNICKTQVNGFMHTCTKQDMLGGCHERTWNNTETGTCESNNRDKVRCNSTTDMHGMMCQVDKHGLYRSSINGLSHICTRDEVKKLMPDQEIECMDDKENDVERRIERLERICHELHRDMKEYSRNFTILCHILIVFGTLYLVINMN